MSREIVEVDALHDYGNEAAFFVVQTVKRFRLRDVGHEVILDHKGGPEEILGLVDQTFEVHLNVHRAARAAVKSVLTMLGLLPACCRFDNEDGDDVICRHVGHGKLLLGHHTCFLSCRSRGDSVSYGSYRNLLARIESFAS